MISRIVVSRRLPSLVIVPRRYTSSVKEGSVAQSKGFNKKEKAHEDEYARRHENELLQKLRKEIQAKKEELAALEEKHAAEASKAN